MACEPNPATFVKISSAMRAKGYSDEESKDKTKGRTQPGRCSSHTTTLVAKERIKVKDTGLMTVQVIEQVEGEFRFRGFHVSLSKTTINKYIADNMEKQPSGRR